MTLIVRKNRRALGRLLIGMSSLLATLLLATAPGWARPVTYTGGQVLISEFEPNKTAWRYGYSPSFRWSASVGGLYLDGVADNPELNVTYVRAARLAKRWNWPTAQANLFVWGGVGVADTGLASKASGHLGFQADFETRRIYTSLVSEHHEGSGWRYRTDTLALGLAPYEHDFERPALWVVLKGMRQTHTLKDDPKAALMLRLFNPTWWFEAGIDDQGQLLGNVMVNF